MLFSKFQKPVFAIFFTFLAGIASANETRLGVYSGSIRLFENTSVEIPISVSIELTGEVVTDSEGNEEGVLDGAFVIDGEGGPYIFTKLSIDEIDGRFDFRYDRPADLGDNRPASFRLVGYLDNDGVISGRVLSGNRGHIGEFRLEQRDIRHLETSPRYDGFWRGYAITPTNVRVPFHIELSAGLEETVNPGSSEFEFTLGKVASIRWNNIKLSMNNVVIDYLRGKVRLSKADANGGPGLVIEYSLDRETGEIAGVIRGAQRGTVARFTLPRFIYEE